MQGSAITGKLPTPPPNPNPPHHPFYGPRLYLNSIFNVKLAGQGDRNNALNYAMVGNITTTFWKCAFIHGTYSCAQTLLTSLIPIYTIQTKKWIKPWHKKKTTRLLSAWYHTTQPPNPWPAVMYHMAAVPTHRIPQPITWSIISTDKKSWKKKYSPKVSWITITLSNNDIWWL